MGFFSKALGAFGLKNNNPNPANNAAPYLNQVPGIGRQYLQDYIGQGREGESTARHNYNLIDNLYRGAPDLYAQSPLNQSYGELENDPAAYLDKLQRSYKPSEGYKYRENKLRQEMSNTAAQGGFAGTQDDEARRAEALNGILGQDMQQFVQNLLGIKGIGLEGQERLLAGRDRNQERMLGGQERSYTNQADFERERGWRGYDAAKELSAMLSNNSGAQAGLSFMGQRYHNIGKEQTAQNRMDLLKSGASYMSGAPDPKGSRWAELFSSKR